MKIANDINDKSEEDNINDELIKLYGKFLIEFEFICSRIRFAILKIIYPAISVRERNIVEIMTEGLTADPLRKKLLGLVIEFYPKDSPVTKATSSFSKKFIEQIELRNTFAHGTAFVGAYDFIAETTEGAIAIKHPKIKTGGLELNFKSFNRARLESLILNVELLNQALNLLIVIYSHPEQNEEFQKRYLLMFEKIISSF